MNVFFLWFTYNLKCEKIFNQLSVVVEIYDLQKTEEANYKLLQEVYFQRI